MREIGSIVTSKDDAQILDRIDRSRNRPYQTVCIGIYRCRYQ